MASSGLKFLSRDELLSFRTATTLLRYLYVLEKRDEAEGGKVANLLIQSNKAKVLPEFKM